MKAGIDERQFHGRGGPAVHLPCGAVAVAASLKRAGLRDRNRARQLHLPSSLVLLEAVCCLSLKRGSRSYFMDEPSNQLPAILAAVTYAENKIFCGVPFKSLPLLRRNRNWQTVARSSSGERSSDRWRHRAPSVDVDANASMLGCSGRPRGRRWQIH